MDLRLEGWSCLIFAAGVARIDAEDRSWSPSCPPTADRNEPLNRPLLPRPEPHVGGRPLDHARAIRAPARAARIARLPWRELYRGRERRAERAGGGGDLR